MKRLILLSVFVLILFGCSGPSESEKYVAGMVTVIGHEPFAGLALRLDNNDAVLLDCSKEIESELIKIQGYRIVVVYEESWVVNGIKTVKVKRYGKI